jgi:hypothetical protein
VRQAGGAPLPSAFFAPNFMVRLMLQQDRSIKNTAGSVEFSRNHLN